MSALRREGLRTSATRALEAYWKKCSDIAPDVQIEFARTLAMCILEDPTISRRTHLDNLGRLDRAREVLKQARALSVGPDPDLSYDAGRLEYLCWEREGRRESLERALAFYCEASSLYQKQPFRADALCRAVFLLDLLAYLEAHAVGTNSLPETVALRQATAERYRQEILSSSRGLQIKTANYRECLTMAATLYGVGRREEACEWLGAALAADPKHDPDFEYLIRQFVMLACIKTGTPTKIELKTQEPWQTLSNQFGSYAVLSWISGKVGLALSGGGFRASLFHLSVLAKLAELDLLRFVEVLSCVSGGSIIEAYYYLELRKLLQQHPDRDVRQEDYQKLVRHLIENFLNGANFPQLRQLVRCKHCASSGRSPLPPTGFRNRRSHLTSALFVRTAKPTF